MVKRVGLANVLIAFDPSRNEDFSMTEEAFLRQQWNMGDVGFLLSALKSSNLRPAYKRVLSDLIDGQLKRPKSRPLTKDGDLLNASRALKVLDLEKSGFAKRESALEQASTELGCKKRTLQKALKEFEEVLKSAEPSSLGRLRAFKSRT